MSKAFPVLDGLSGKRVIDLGCGAGACLGVTATRAKEVLCVDVSTMALELVKEKFPMVDTLQCDLQGDGTELPRNWADLGLLVFTLSALRPDRQIEALRHCAATLKPGGVLLFRDYGMFDHVQTKEHTMRVGECTIQKGDGVLCTFFDLEFIIMAFGVAGLTLHEPPKYCTVKNLNRKTGEELFRVFVQAVGQKT